MPWAATQGSWWPRRCTDGRNGGPECAECLDRCDTPGDADAHHRDVGKGVTPMTVSFLLTPEQEQLKAAARGFAQEQLPGSRLGDACGTRPSDSGAAAAAGVRECCRGGVPQGPDP